MTTKNGDPFDLAASEVAGLTTSAADIAGFDFGDDVEFATARNVCGVRDEYRTFSRRLDSRTVFANDTRYGPTRDLGAWTGAKRPLLTACRKVLRAAGISRREIAGIEAVTELGGTVEAGQDKQPSARPLRRIAIARRSIEDVPVWSSHCIVELTREMSLGAVELHWPWIPPEIVAEAAVLRHKVAPQLSPDRIEGAAVESVEVGIVHSPAIGFHMDVNAAIRVVYEPEHEGFGRKAVRYLDRHGEVVERPRDLVATRADAGERPGRQASAG